MDPQQSVNSIEVTQSPSAWQLLSAALSRSLPRKHAKFADGSAVTSACPPSTLTTSSRLPPSEEPGPAPLVPHAASMSAPRERTVPTFAMPCCRVLCVLDCGSEILRRREHTSSRHAIRSALRLADAGMLTCKHGTRECRRLRGCRRVAIVGVERRGARTSSKDECNAGFGRASHHERAPEHL